MLFLITTQTLCFQFSVNQVVLHLTVTFINAERLFKYKMPENKKNVHLSFLFHQIASFVQPSVQNLIIVNLSQNIKNKRK